MKNILLLMFAGLFLVACSGPKGLSEKKLKENNYQQVERFAMDNRILPDQYPMYPDGGLGFVRDARTEQVYPPAMRNQNIKGTVQVEFTIDKKGKVVNERVTQSLHPQADKEALRVIKSLKDWYPAKFQDKFVDCNMGMPFHFDPDGNTAE